MSSGDAKAAKQPKGLSRGRNSPERIPVELVARCENGAPRPRSGRLQGFSRERNLREQIPVLRRRSAKAAKAAVFRDVRAAGIRPRIPA
jgi:hypothetical protein